ncbi:MAG: glycosyltransferase [Saccharofermentans sp.]|nr:glycosyltransferase [Saccharofermentans sp.]
MKKICFVTTIYLTYRMFLKQFSQYLYKTGEYDISLICNNEDGITDDLPQYVHYYPVKMERGINISAFTAINQIKKIIKENNFDIVQYSTPNAAFYTSIAAQSLKVPVRLYCQWGIRYMGFEGWKRSLFKILEKITCDNSTFIEAESHNIRDFSMGEGLYSSDRSRVIWNGSASGVDLSKFDASQRNKWRAQIREEKAIMNEEVVFAFAGRLTADKGINELFEAFFRILDKYPNVKLMVMGGMDNSASLNQDLYKKAINSSHVIFTGSVNDIERYYAASDVFVAPSYREGFGLVVVEAEAMGLPAIVSNVPGQIDAISDGVTGISCEVKNSDSLMNAMVQLIDNKQQRINMGEAAYNFAKRGFEQKQLFNYLKKHRDELISND